MPKELTHWHIAGEALKRGIPVEVEKIIGSNFALYYIGSVAHDIPFYDLSKPTNASIDHLANQLHGVEGEDTLVPLIEIMEKALFQKNRQASLAFLLGMLTHFITDSVFHPMVYYMSGNYFANNEEERGKAIFRHRLLETAIDLRLKTVEPMEYPVSLNQLWCEAGDLGRHAFNLVVAHYAFQGENSLKARFKKARRNHRLLQKAFSSSFLWQLVTIYRRYGHPEVEKLEALFYSQPLDLSFFEETLVWLHPVTGDTYRMSLDELYNSCVNKVIVLFEQLAKQPLEKWPLLLRELPPLSLDSGLPYVPVSKMKYFLTEPIEDRLRYDIK